MRESKREGARLREVPASQRHANEFPRELAIQILARVLNDRRTLDDAFEEVLAGKSLEPKARAWLQDVCSGTLRWKGRIDLVLDSIALKKKPTGWLRRALLVAAYQLLAQEKAHPGAVVSETVDEVKREEGQAPAQFANALLRKISAHAAQWRELAAPSGPAVEQARWASLPEWMWRRLVKDHGPERASAYAGASLDRPVTWARFREGAPLPAWAEAGPVAGSYRLTEGGAIPEKPGFREGHFFVQDISSQALVAEVSAAVREALGKGGKDELQALDLCAAPGGKAAGLAWNGFRVIASDRDESRLRLLRETVARVAPEIVVATGVASAAQDLVWVDAPCTGSGILRRHPEVRWLRQEKELDALADVQRELLREGWSKVRPGGFLAYSVCSVLKEEGEGALARAELDGAEPVRRWELWPQEPPHGDGFWAALIRKRG